MEFEDQTIELLFSTAATIAGGQKEIPLKKYADFAYGLQNGLVPMDIAMDLIELHRFVADCVDSLALSQNVYLEFDRNFEEIWVATRRSGFRELVKLVANSILCDIQPGGGKVHIFTYSATRDSLLDAPERFKKGVIPTPVWRSAMQLSEAFAVVTFANQGAGRLEYQLMERNRVRADCCGVGTSFHALQTLALNCMANVTMQSVFDVGTVMEIFLPVNHHG